MSALASERQVDPLFAAAYIAHLDTQLESARRMLGIVLEQGAAIRRRDVQNVVRLAGALQVEMHHREVIENDRMKLFERAAPQLGPDTDAGGITLTALEALMDPDSAYYARFRSRELSAALDEIQREHQTNRVLMQQELAFLDHLLRLAGSGGSGAYLSRSDQGTRRVANGYIRKRVFDVEA